MKIAIVKLSAMGDIIHAMVALQYIKKFDKNIEIDWIVESAFEQILEHNPHIDNILQVNLKKIKQNKSLIFDEIKAIKKYAHNNYDLVIDAQGLVKSAITAKLLSQNANIAGYGKKSIRESFATYFYKSKFDIAYDENTIDRNAYILSAPLGFEISSKEIIEKEPFIYFEPSNLVDEIIKEKQIDRFVVFIIGSTWKSRNYPKERFAKIASHFVQKGYHMMLPWGNQEEYDDARFIATSIENDSKITVLPQLNLNGLKYLISKSSLLIGNDTGPTHLAWGLNVASITIFGPTPINRVYQTPINKVVKSSSKVNHYKLNKNDFSICEIEESEIIKIADELVRQ
jgi:heptosyltransferase-1